MHFPYPVFSLADSELANSVIAPGNTSTISLKLNQCFVIWFSLYMKTIFFKGSYFLHVYFILLHSGKTSVSALEINNNLKQ